MRERAGAGTQPGGCWTRVGSTYLPLRHQLPLGGGGGFDQRAGGRRDGLGRLQNLLLKVQALVGLLWSRERREDGRDGDGDAPGGQARTLGLVLGLSCSSFLAAASMAAAAPRSSFSAMTVGSSGSTHSVPAGDTVPEPG